jgi:putative heme-binding domain-containing protein
VRDPNGHDGTVNTHGGWIAQIDSTGGNFNLISAGFRNPFDLAFNESGDMFTFDSDMEWDFGLPWYRPIRICHVPSGGEFGWRPGTDKWSPTNPDNLPGLLNIGQGSPTGVFSGINAHFPEKYRRSIFAFDWTFGVMYAIQPIAEGASYTPKTEEFISGSPLPLTDGMVGPDGAVYFLTGGRRIESDLYRVYYKDNKQNTEQLAASELTESQKIRRKLESYHGAPKADALEFAWPYLKNEDRFIRYAARMVVEHQPAQEWAQKAIDEKDPVILTQAAIAQARLGNKEIKDKLLKSLTSIDFSKLSDDQRIDLIRAFELIYLRLGNPSIEIQSQVVSYLDSKYPAQSNNLNRSLSKLLVYLDAPGSVEKTMKLMATAKDDPNDQKTFMESSDLILRNPRYGLDIAGMLASVPPKQQTFYATVLSQAKNGWTPALQEEYFKWFYTAFGYKGGYSFVGFINIIRNNALKNVSKDKLAYFKTISGDSLVERAQMGLAQNDIQPKGPGRRWEVDTALAFLKDGMSKRNFEQGKAMFATSLCVKCHSMNGQGGISGPNLTNVGTRFSYKDMLESIIEPNKTISDQFASTVFYLKDGSSVVGKMINEDEKNYFIGQNPFAMHVVKEVAKKNVIRKRLSKESFMMSGLINRLNPEELKDLLAYMKSGGNPKDSLFIAKSNN